MHQGVDGPFVTQVVGCFLAAGDQQAAQTPDLVVGVNGHSFDDNGIDDLISVGLE